MIRSILTACAALSAALVAVGFLGDLHRSADSIALLRPIAGILCFAGLAASSRVLKGSFALIAVLALITVMKTALPQDPGGDVRVYSKNLWAPNIQSPQIAADIASAGVDVVMLQEVSDNNRTLLALLEPEFPHQHLCYNSAWRGVAVASRFPFDGEPLCSTVRAIAAAPLRISDQRVWAVSAHIPWPWPFDSAADEAAAVQVLSRLDGPVIMAGDFNITPWSGRITRMMDLTRTRLAGPVWPTFTLGFVPLPIDMAMAPGGGQIQRRPLMGSDHRGIVADLSLAPRP